MTVALFYCFIFHLLLSHNKHNNLIVKPKTFIRNDCFMLLEKTTNFLFEKCIAFDFYLFTFSTENAQKNHIYFMKHAHENNKNGS